MDVYTYYYTTVHRGRNPRMEVEAAAAAAEAAAKCMYSELFHTCIYK